MSHLPRVEITRFSPSDYAVNLTLVRANNSSTSTIDSGFTVIADSRYIRD